MLSMTRIFPYAGLLLLVFLALQAPSRVQGQKDPDVTSPRIMSLPQITLPDGVEAPPDGRVNTVLLVASDGSATLEQCEAGAELCALVRNAIEAARFEPARRDDQPIAARVRVTLALTQPATKPEPEAKPTPAPGAASTAQPTHGTDAGQDSRTGGQVGKSPAPSSPTAAGSTPRPAAPQPDFSATARVAPPQPGMRRLELAEMRDLPGAFGDPFRAIDSLPGVVPVLSGLPYFYIRGSPPAGTLYVYDDIAVPTLYHLAIGPAVIHPRMVGPIRLYSGVAPARYGRLTGGAVVGEGPEAPDGRTHAEAELRLLDVSAYLQTPVGDGTLTAAVRYGYPGLLLSILSPDVGLQYWDYQLRYAGKLSSQDRVELVALGSYDSLSVADRASNDVVITFHRFEPRLIRRIDHTEYGVAILLGFDQSSLGSQFQLRSTRVGPRVWLEQRFDENNKLRLSADLIGVAGFFSATMPNTNMGGGEVRNSLFGDVPARSMWGVQAELTLRPWHALEFQLGARADAWVQKAGAESVLDPRVRVILHTSDEFELHVAAGVVHQPAVFFLPLPGIADIATDRGLQTAIQSEAGIGWDTPLALRVELQAFLHHYDNLVFTDALLLSDSFDMICQTIQCGSAKVPDRIDGFSYGAELFLKRNATERLSGWISYTLAWSAVDDVVGLHYTPTWDVRHVGNLVVQWNMGAGFSAGARLQARSGKLQGAFVLDDKLQLSRDERRLPAFARLDLQLAYAWPTWWGRLRISLEWFNATFAREATELVCTGTPRMCQTVYLPAIFFPNLGLRGEI
jgi:hypothetical protein